jgi:hypothetical protein
VNFAIDTQTDQAGHSSAHASVHAPTLGDLDDLFATFDGHDKG